MAHPRTLLGILLLAAALLACDLPLAPGTWDYAAELARRKGRIAAVDVWVTESAPGHVTRDFEIRSTSGLVVRGRYRSHPSADAADPRPTVILLGGIDRGGDAVSLLPPDVFAGAAALWYPAELNADDAQEALRRADRLGDLAWDVPASVMLAADFLAARPEVDATRLAVVGASFGGFFVPAAAAADPRLRNVALLYTGGDLAGLIADYLYDDVPPAAAVLGAEMASLRLQRLEPTRYMADIAPRHVLLVNGVHDERITRRSAEALIAATREPKDVVWLPTGHLDPDDEPLLRALVDTALARLPVLGAP